MDEQIRQGDVFLVRVSDSTEAPAGGRKVAKDGGRVVLAYGEQTGHAHAISQPWAELFESMNGERTLVLPKEAVLSHEEHTAHTLAPGSYRVVRQMEYTPERIFNVAD